MNKVLIIDASETDGRIIREFGIRNTIKKLNRQLEKAADSFGNITDI